MEDNPPSYDDSFLHASDSGSLSVSDKDSGSNLPPAGSTSVPEARTSFLSRFREVFQRRPLSDRRPDSQIKSTVVNEVRTLVQPYTGSAADRVALLKRCARLCTRHKLDFSSLLQETSIHGHTALYWAIVNGPWPPRAPFALVAAVLAHSAPLKPETMHEARRACVLVKSQELLQFLRCCPEFGALSAEARFLLGVRVPPEEIVVEHREGDAQPFLVNFRIPLFLKRMALARDIKLEFIARGQLWQLSFFTAVNPTQRWLKNGARCAALTLAEDGPSTHREFDLVFLDARPSPPSGPRHFWASGGSDDPLVGRQPSSDGNVTVFSWQIFDDDTVCVAEDGSINGILGTSAALVPSGAKLPVRKENKDSWWHWLAIAMMAMLVMMLFD